MPDGTNGESGRLDRIERLMDRLVEDHILFRVEHRQLLKAQVILTDTVQKQAEALGTLREAVGSHQEAIKVLEGKLAELADAQKNADDRMAALIVTVDDLIRRPPLQ